MAVRGADETVVVVVEDDPNIARLVDMYLRRDGYRVYKAADGATGLDRIKQYRPKLVILDIGLPGDVDGIQLCRELRATSDIPIIMLTARDSEVDRIVGLELGADDYVTKPFSPGELVARIRAVLRRVDAGARAVLSPILESGEVEVDTARREVRLRGDLVQVTAREFDLLQYLVENTGRVLAVASCWTACGDGTGWVTNARWTSTSSNSVRSSVMLCGSLPCGAWVTCWTEGGGTCSVGCRSRWWERSLWPCCWPES